MSGPARGASTTATPVIEADDESGDAQAESATVVQIDDLERQDGAVADVVQEDPEYDEPATRAESEAESPQELVIVQISPIH